MFGIAVFWGVVVLCAASLDLENELKEIRTILARQEREIQNLQSENRDLRSENRVLQADMRRMVTEIENLKTDNFLRTELMSQNEELRENNRNEVLKSRILNTEADKKSKIERPRTIRLALEPLAFYAYMENNEHNPSNHHPIIFNHVQTNEGHGYNELSGVFTAPNPGVYFFTWTIYSGGHGVTRFHIYVNNGVLGYTFGNTDGTDNYDSNSGSMVVRLNTHDSVYIRSGMDCTTSIISNSYYGRSTFAGWKLF